MRARAALGVALAVAAQVAVAQARALQDRPRPVVVVAVRGSDQDLAALRLVLDELLARIDLDARVTAGVPASDDTGNSAFATIFVDVTGRNSASVAVQEGRSGPVRLLRQIEHAGSRALLIDTAAHVIYAMLETMVGESASPGDARPASGPDDPAPDRSAPTPVLAQAARPPASGVRGARWGIELSPIYGVRSLALPDQRPAMNAGLAVSAGSRGGRLQPSLVVSAMYGLDVELGAGPGTQGQVFGRMQVISLHAVPVVNLIGTGRLLLQGGLGGGVDVVRLQTTMPPMMGPPGPMGPGNAVPISTRARHVDPLLATLMVARLAITPGTQAFLAGTVDYGPTYPIQMGFGSSTLRMPNWRFQGSLGLAVTLGGRAPAWPPGQP
jgi:hypothetical protein